MKTAIVIPARYGSTRFPGKPLALIAGKTMLARVHDAAKEAAKSYKDTSVFITTDDGRIAAHAREIGAEYVMTPVDCPTGSDRVLAALRLSNTEADFVINLQGDAPLTPPALIAAMIGAFVENPALEVVTPVHRLGWDELDALREAKKTTPFTGTTAVLDQKGHALWFSKSILPAMRDEKTLRASDKKSPVHQHIGLYGFRMDILEKFCGLPQSMYEKIEGLEQLRLLENGIQIQTVLSESAVHAGVDSPEDIARAEAALR